MSISNSKNNCFLYTNYRNIYPKGRALMQMYKM